MLKNNLEIILITFNRKNFLQKTLSSLLGEHSPVREIQLTILDNASTDGTGELLRQYAARYPNIKHIRNPKNIGPNANIVHAFELAQKPYVWVLCDDDEYDFSAFEEVVAAMEEKADLIVVNTEFTQGDATFPALYRLLTFLPAAIYKTSHITSEVLINMYNNLPNWFPHLAYTADMINHNNRHIVSVSSNIVKRGGEENNEWNDKTEDLSSKTLPLTAKYSPFLPPSQKYKFIEVGYLASCELIQDKHLRAQAVRVCQPNKSLCRIFRNIIKQNIRYCQSFKGNYAIVGSVLNTKQKLLFFLQKTFSFYRIRFFFKHLFASIQKFEENK